MQKEVEEKAKGYLSYWLRGTLQTNRDVNLADVQAVWENCITHAEKELGYEQNGSQTITQETCIDPTGT